MDIETDATLDRFAYHMPEYEQLKRMEKLRKGYRTLHLLLTELTEPSREQALAITYLEESATRANKAVVFEGRELE